MAGPSARIRSFSIDSKIEKLKTEIQKLESEKLIEARKLERLKSDAAGLEKLASENKQTLDAYNKGFKNLEKEKKEFETYYDTKRTMIVAALRNKKVDVDRVIQRFDGELAAKKKELKATEVKYGDADHEYDAAKKVYDERQKDYQELRDYQRKTEAKLVELRGLKERIEKEDPKNLANIYILIEEVKRVLRETQMKTYKRLTNELSRAWVALDSARENLMKKEEVLDAAKTSFESSKRELEVLDRNRREEILSRI
jgi:hypothetical protein